MYKKAIPPQVVHAFFGSDAPVEVKEEYERFNDSANDYLHTLRNQGEAHKGQSIEDATQAFFGVQSVPENKRVKEFAEPIPGYSGVNRRVQADNVFGMTYQEARRVA
mmetsp:Transcript_17642/g.29803  ORF Transcript_17642/g.29803 Transcript_17642/m.29803 type:complete len:107 (+) Transcript_17642:359-679(+)|eukprot:CAMPEP_0168626192 /NCGR_PEP_ID=MMETSP0449_2-20121227/10480_1 /TAXON_ID=1082188 /ORGANISM="Strombidium rassoulzadegani, Strain ras09" /LENGTH=106 /DNA_ID=CAMNT_0008668129 /DNA_START=354 /DNA_END=674 /DNA_ORIENTATION=-